MSIYAVAPPGEHAEVMSRWSVFEVKCVWSEERTRHLVGYIPSLRDGRSSSPIQAFDSDKMQITTSSGRIYQLLGCPGVDSDADYVWKHYKKVNGITDIVDVTCEYYDYNPKYIMSGETPTRKDLEKSVPIVNRAVRLLDIPEPYATEFSKYCLGRAIPEHGKYWAADWQRWLAMRFKHNA